MPTTPEYANVVTRSDSDLGTILRAVKLLLVNKGLGTEDNIKITFNVPTDQPPIPASNQIIIISPSPTWTRQFGDLFEGSEIILDGQLTVTLWVDIQPQEQEGLDETLASDPVFGISNLFGRLINSIDDNAGPGSNLADASGNSPLMEPLVFLGYTNPSRKPGVPWRQLTANFFCRYRQVRN